MAKRGNGEGSIYYRNSDKKWVGSVTLGKGKRKVIYGKTRKEVQEKLKIVLHEQQQGTLVTAAPQTVSQFLTDWLENTHIGISSLRCLFPRREITKCSTSLSRLIFR